MTVSDIAAQCAPLGLFVMGCMNDDGAGAVLLGAGAAFWPVFTNSPEYRDGLKDPIDRWSKRHINAMAATCDGQAVYPSDGPPYAPFIHWALQTGRFWQSPTGMMVHDTAGLMISIRGAIRVPYAVKATQSVNPCMTCTTQPCATACPVNALTETTQYDVPTCKAYLDTPAGSTCMTQGCQARTICPVSQKFNRATDQSAFHMRAFMGA